MDLVKGGLYIDRYGGTVRVRLLGVSTRDPRGRAGPFAMMQAWNTIDGRWGPGWQCWKALGHWDEFRACRGSLTDAGHR